MEPRTNNELTSGERRELEQLRRERGVQRRTWPVPPLPVNRLTEHIEEDRAYRAEFRAMKGSQVGRRLAEGVTDIHHDFADRAQGDPFLGQLLSRIEATVVVSGTELIARYMNPEDER